MIADVREAKECAGVGGVGRSRADAQGGRAPRGLAGLFLPILVLSALHSSDLRLQMEISGEICRAR